MRDGGVPAMPRAPSGTEERPHGRSSDRARDRTATEARILGAVATVLARDGCSGIGVNAIAKQAGVDKVLIYRYFGGLPELLRAWGASGHFWPRVADLLGPDPQALLALPADERYARFFDHFIDELRQRPLTLEILVAELTERNDLTALLEAEREAWGEEAVQVLGGAEFAARPHLQGVTLLLVAGVQYLLLRSRRIRSFGGLELRSEAGWLQLKQAIRTLARQTFAAAPA
jgi:AcrR family transcriptional regulator